MDINRALEFVEGDKCSLHCGSYGGRPPTKMTIFLDREEITSRFAVDYTSELTGVAGLRLIDHRTEIWSDRLKVSSDHDNKRLQCIVNVDGLGSSISTVKIRVSCEYNSLLVSLTFSYKI